MGVYEFNSRSRLLLSVYVFFFLAGAASVKSYSRFRAHFMSLHYITCFYTNVRIIVLCILSYYKNIGSVLD